MSVSMAASRTRPEIDLDEEVNALAALVALLREESSLLASGAAETVEQIAARKTSRLPQLRSFADRLMALAVADGHTASAEGVRAWFAARPAQGAAWKKLITLAEEARILNELNGRTIAALSDGVERRLRLLSSAGTGPLTYGANGRASLGARMAFASA